MRRIRTLIILTLTLLLPAAFCLPAFAAGEDPGVFCRAFFSENNDSGSNQDEQSEDPDAAGQAVPAADSLVWLSNTMYFDLKTGEFIYPIGSTSSQVRSNAADGMITTEPVSVSGVAVTVYRNGTLFEDDISRITEPGEYVVLGQSENQNPRLFTFRLVDKTADIGGYTMPTGMNVNSASCDGEPIYFRSDYVPMENDGKYHIEYECPSTGRKYGLELTVDRKPPELAFSGSIDENNRVYSALHFAGVEPGDTLYVTLDGKQIDVTVNSDGTGELTQSGSYVIKAFDAAGNSTEYGYTVMIYFNAGSIAFFVLLIASIIAVIVYVYIKRKRLQIG